jgi:hypothetical protein
MEWCGMVWIRPCGTGGGVENRQKLLCRAFMGGGVGGSNRGSLLWSGVTSFCMYTAAVRLVVLVLVLVPPDR